MYLYNGDYNRWTSERRGMEKSVGVGDRVATVLFQTAIALHAQHSTDGSPFYHCARPECDNAATILRLYNRTRRKAITKV